MFTITGVELSKFKSTSMHMRVSVEGNGLKKDTNYVKSQKVGLQCEILGKHGILMRCYQREVGSICSFFVCCVPTDETSATEMTFLQTIFFTSISKSFVFSM